jgi:hypothetical protein
VFPVLHAFDLVAVGAQQLVSAVLVDQDGVEEFPAAVVDAALYSPVPVDVVDLQRGAGRVVAASVAGASEVGDNPQVQPVEAVFACLFFAGYAPSAEAVVAFRFAVEVGDGFVCAAFGAGLHLLIVSVFANVTDGGG